MNKRTRSLINLLEENDSGMIIADSKVVRVPFSRVALASPKHETAKDRKTLIVPSGEEVGYELFY